MKSLKALPLLLVLFVLIMSGCKADTSGSKDSVKQNNDNNTEKIEVTVKEGEEIVIGFSQRTVAGSDWYRNLIDGAEARAEELGVELIVLDAQGDEAKQVADVEDLIARSVDVVIMNPQDPVSVLPVTNKLQENNIPLVVVNSNIDAKANPVTFVSDDPRDTGYKLGWELASIASEKHGDKVYKAAMISGFPKELVSQYRRNGIVSGWVDFMLEKYGKSNLNLVAERFGEWTPDKTLPEMQDIASAHPDLDIVFSLSDVMLPGIYSALKDNNLYDKVLIGSMDGTKTAIKNIIDEPDKGLSVTVSNDPRLQGADAVSMAVKVAQGEEVPPIHYIANPVVNSQNAKDMYDPDSSY